MSPTMVFKQDGFSNGVNSMGDLFMALGASGGPKIITAVVQVIINHAHLGMPLFEAVVHPRIHDQLLYHSGDVTTMENSVLDQGPIITVQNRTKLALMNRGHLLTDIDYAGTVQAISIDFESKTLTAVSDIRKGGLPCGY
jgi:gamma-glutamyltranspeptidase